MTKRHDKQALAVAQLGRKVRGGRIHTMVLSGITDPLGEEADLAIWDSVFLGFRRPGAPRLRQFLAETGPIHPSIDPKSGARTVTQFVFSHIIVAIPRAVYQHDAYECNYEGINALIQGLERLCRDEYGNRLWEPDRGIRVRVVPHDLDGDQVIIKVGRAVSLPGPDDLPMADIAITYRSEEGIEKTVPLQAWHHYAGRPGHLELIEKPVAVYPGDRYLLLSPHEDLAPVVTAAVRDADDDDLPIRFGIDLVRKIGLIETGRGLTATEIPPDIHDHGVLVFTFEAVGRSPVPGGQPEALIVTVSPRTDWKEARDLQEEEAPRHLEAPDEDGPAAPADTPASGLLKPFSPLSAPSAFNAVDRSLAGDQLGDPTIIFGPRPGVATSLLALDVIAISLHALPPGGGVRSWKLSFDANGGIVAPQRGSSAAREPASLEIGATAARPGLWMARPGATGWDPLTAPGEATLPDGTILPLLKVPQELEDAYLGFLELPELVTLTLPAGRHILGRAGGTADQKLAIGLLTQPGSLEAAEGQGSACIEQLGLSKDHVTLWVEGQTLCAEIIGRAPIWHLSGDLAVVDSLYPGDSRMMRLALDDHLLVGPYLTRVREI